MILDSGNHFIVRIWSGKTIDVVKITLLSNSMVSSRYTYVFFSNAKNIY